MFCPKCSQQQVSEEVRFCSRCGFQLGIVKALLVAEDTPETLAQGTRATDRSLRKRDLTIGAFFMFVFAVVVAAVTIDMPPSHSARILVLIVAWMILTLLINIVPLMRYFFKGDASSSADSAAPSKTAPGLITQVRRRAHNSALPPAQSIPATDFGRQGVETSEVVRPPSVTEQTTNLLNNK